MTRSGAALARTIPSRLPVAASTAMREVLEAVSDVAPTPTSVLLVGESGTGKELIARAIHARSRRTGAWVAVNCAALPGDLLESELFGHERGAFTGATERRAGKFELANGGTLLLDEISELPLALQAKLLRAIQEREIDRVGGARPIPVDTRLIATTNRDLAAMVRRGAFRSDLYYRLNVFPIVIPPLRDRPEDLPALAEHLVDEMAREMGRPAPTLADAALEALRRHAFPGNVRELRNVLERALVRCHGTVLEPAALRLGDALAPSQQPADAGGAAPRGRPAHDADGSGGDDDLGAAPGSQVVDHRSRGPRPHEYDLAGASPTPRTRSKPCAGPDLLGATDLHASRLDAPGPSEALCSVDWDDQPSSLGQGLTPLFSLRDAPLDLAALERVAIAEALRRVGGNRTHAARILGIGLRTLRNKLRLYRDSGHDVEPTTHASHCGPPDQTSRTSTRFPTSQSAGTAAGQALPCTSADHPHETSASQPARRARLSQSDFEA